MTNNKLHTAVLQSLPIFNTTPAIVLSPLKHGRRFWPLTNPKDIGKAKGPNGIIGSEKASELTIQLNQWIVESQLGVSPRKKVQR